MSKNRSESKLIKSQGVALVVRLVLSIDDLASGGKYLIICLVEKGRELYEQDTARNNIPYGNSYGKIPYGGEKPPKFIMLECSKTGWKKC